LGFATLGTLRFDMPVQRPTTHGWFWRLLLLASLVLLSWLLAQSLHEAGHVLHAWISGGRVTWVELQPAAFSRTDVAPNPRPLFVVWGGPLWGCVLPLIIWAAVRWVRPSVSYLFAFFAGFCLIMNGAYIGVGAWDGVGDAGDMLRLGTPIWVMSVYGVVCTAVGLLLGHSAGGLPGIGKSGGPVRAPHAIRVFLALLAIAAAEVALRLVFR
jgi:hypothetical protein